MPEEETTTITENVITLPNYSQFESLGEITIAIINTLLLFISIIAVGALIIGGYQYITSGGNAEATAKAKSTITWAVIGLVVCFASYVIINFVVTSLTG